MPTFSTTFTTPGNYTLSDSAEIEVVGGVARLKESLTGIIGRWHLNESSGANVPDSSGNANDGTLSAGMNDADWIPGKLGNGLAFDGSGDWVTLNGIGNFTKDDPFSIECWLRSTTYNGYLVSKFQDSPLKGWATNLFVGGEILFMLAANGSTDGIAVMTSGDFADGTWHHMVCAYDGSSTRAGMSIYVDGVNQSVTPPAGWAQTTVTGDTTTLQPTMLAAQLDSVGLFAGDLDEVLIHSRELTQVNVTSRYNSGNGSEIIYPEPPPWIFKTAGNPGATAGYTTFTETLGGGNQGLARYQLSENGTLWKYWDGATWTPETAGQYNTSVTVNSNIGDFPTDPENVFVKSFLVSNGNQQVELDELAIGYLANQPPFVFAGADKTAKDNQTIFPFSDSTFSDPDGNVAAVHFKIDGEVDVWTEISQGAYGTLLEAVQAFGYAFDEPGAITARLQATDDGGPPATSEDSLVVTVEKYTVTFNVRTSDGDHLSGLAFNPGDGSGWRIDEVSPFTHDYDYSATDIRITVGKIGFGITPLEFATTDHTENLVLTPLAAADPSVTAAAVWSALSSDNVSSGSMGEVMQFLRAVNAGRVQLDSNQMIIFKPDNVTEVARFNLFDKNGNPATQNVADRQRVP